MPPSRFPSMRESLPNERGQHMQGVSVATPPLVLRLA
ncbi:MAG: hypothetical protein ACJASC_001136 [Limimaricola cinnabarinus]|jgi:hypothetical protein